MSKLGYYDHLNDNKVAIKIDMVELVRVVVNMNYGAHRFLSEMVRQRETLHAARIQKYLDDGEDDVAQACEEGDSNLLTRAIRSALEKGGY